MERRVTAPKKPLCSDIPQISTVRPSLLYPEGWKGVYPGTVPKHLKILEFKGIHRQNLYIHLFSGFFCKGVLQKQTVYPTLRLTPQPDSSSDCFVVTAAHTSSHEQD